MPDQTVSQLRVAMPSANGPPTSSLSTTRPMLGWGVGVLGHYFGMTTCSGFRAPARG